MAISVTTRGGKGSPLTNSEMDTNLTNLGRQATELLSGNVQLATQAEVDAGTDTEKAVTSNTISDRVNALLAAGLIAANVGVEETPTAAFGEFRIGSYIIKINYLTGAGSDGTVSHVVPFPNGAYPPILSPVHNANISRTLGQGATAHCKTFDVNGYSFAQGFEESPPNVITPQPLPLLGIQIGF